MADAGNVIGKFQDEVEEAAGEVVQDVKDSVGEMIEQGAQSVIGSQPSPQDKQKQQEDQTKELDRQKNLAYTRRWLKDVETAQEKVRQENKQKEQQRLQVQQQEKQVSEMKKEEKKKQPVNPATFYAGKVEFKRGVGG